MTPKPNALLAGATGRTGEALLNALAASGRYEQIFVLTNRQLRSSTQGVAGWAITAPLDNLALSTHTPPAVRDVFIMSFADRLHSARDNALHTFPAELTTTLATAAAQVGASRLFVVCPIAAQAQMADFKHFYAGVDATLTLANLPYRRVTILLPTATDSTRPAPTFWARLRDSYLAQFRMMLPQSVAPFTPSRFAEAVMMVAADESSGVAVYDAQQLHALLKANKSTKRLVF